MSPQSDDKPIAGPGFYMRRAHTNDLDAIVRLLANDPLGQHRERYDKPLPDAYRQAFEAIDMDTNQLLVVACIGDDVVGVLQLTFLPNMTYQGAWRAQIEGVRIAEHLRSQGIGRLMFAWAIDRARERRCHLVQLATDKTRPDARRFYETLGFVASHEGMKLTLAP